jgi:hypothetical protein
MCQGILKFAFVCIKFARTKTHYFIRSCISGASSEQRSTGDDCLGWNRFVATPSFCQVSCSVCVSRCVPHLRHRLQQKACLIVACFSRSLEAWVCLHSVELTLASALGLPWLKGFLRLGHCCQLSCQEIATNPWTSHLKVNCFGTFATSFIRSCAQLSNNAIFPRLTHRSNFAAAKHSNRKSEAGWHRYENKLKYL